MISTETRCWAIQREGHEHNAYPARIMGIETRDGQVTAINCGAGARFERTPAGHWVDRAGTFARLVPVLPLEMSDFEMCVKEGLYIVQLLGRYDEVPAW